MNGCMWVVFCLGEEGESFKRDLVNHQIHKTQTIIETVRARHQDPTNVAACGFFHYDRTGKQNLVNLSL